eukprot:Amastigsp_a340643_24.p2 type:complete len:279 gc:universal Amastigsp_a340643_24:1115-279(-)
MPETQMTGSSRRCPVLSTTTLSSTSELPTWTMCSQSVSSMASSPPGTRLRRRNISPSSATRSPSTSCTSPEPSWSRMGRKCLARNSVSTTATSLRSVASHMHSAAKSRCSRSRASALRRKSGIALLEMNACASSRKNAADASRNGVSKRVVYTSRLSCPTVTSMVHSRWSCERSITSPQRSRRIIASSAAGSRSETPGCRTTTSRNSESPSSKTVGRFLSTTWTRSTYISTSRMRIIDCMCDFHADDMASRKSESASCATMPATTVRRCASTHPPRPL